MVLGNPGLFRKKSSLFCSKKQDGFISNRETVITRFDLYNSDECFLTGTAAEVIPVVEVDTRVIGTGKPGSMTLRLIDEFHKYTQHEGTPVYKE